MNAFDSQLYIGAPNGIVLCAERGDGHTIRGRFYHAYSREEIEFENTDQLIYGMEEFFDSIQFPHPSTNIRSFTNDNTKKDSIRYDWAKDQLSARPKFKKRERVMEDQELLSRHADMGSFIIRVHQRQNSSMQGRLTWVEKNKTVCFRSAWEMIRLIDSALDENCSEQDDDQNDVLPNWND